MAAAAAAAAHPSCDLMSPACGAQSTDMVEYLYYLAVFSYGQSV